MSLTSRRTVMARKRYKPEEIVAKLRQVDVLVSQGQAMADAIRPLVTRACWLPLRLDASSTRPYSASSIFIGRRGIFPNVVAPAISIRCPLAAAKMPDSAAASAFGRGPPL